MGLNQTRDDEVRAAAYFSIALFCMMMGTLAVRRLRK